MKTLVSFVTQWWPVITTVLLPFLVAAIAKTSWSGSRKAWLAFALSCLVGVLAWLSQGIPISPETLGSVVLTVFGGVTLAYRLFASVGITNSWLEALLNLGSG